MSRVGWEGNHASYARFSAKALVREVKLGDGRKEGRAYQLFSSGRPVRRWRGPSRGR